MGSWFLGPRGENAEIMKEKFDFIVNKVRDGRLDYWPEDPVRTFSSLADLTFPDSTPLFTGLHHEDNDRVPRLSG
jgi:hypothetical protein